MKIKNFVGLASAFVLASGMSVWAQTPIRVEVTGQATTHHAASTAIPVTITNPIIGTIQVKIYDENSLNVNGGVPSNSIGPVTISGSVGTSGTPLLEVLIADGDTSFPITPPESMSEGAIDFDGLSFSNTDLRDIARVAVAVYGDITGNIEAGAIRRIQALGRGSGGSYAGGKITGNITATSPDFSLVAGGFGFVSFRAIGVIWAGDEISGTISATSDHSTNPGGLTWLLVGSESNLSIDGLLGDVRIDHGSIEKIHTAGPIGSVSVTPKIWAGREITEVRALDKSDLGSTFPTGTIAADIKADIRTGLVDSEPGVHGPLTLLKTDGDLSGEINAANVAYGSSTLQTGACGIIVGGAITAPINIRYNLETADIIAASIDAPVTIGVRLKGGIIATAPNGQIVSVEIGYANEGLDEEDPEYDPVVDEYTAVWPRGFTGSACRPVDPSFVTPFDEYTHADWTAEVAHCSGFSTFDGGSIDSVIRASTIGTIRIVELNALYTLGQGQGTIKPYHPRIESPAIDELRIERLREGVVWSGRMSATEGGSGWEPTWDPEDAYASIGTIVVDCIGPAGDLWVDGATRIQVTGDVLGQIHVPALTETVWIGGRLGVWNDFDDTCVNSYPENYSYTLSTASSEDSPRDTTWTDEDSYDPLRRRGEIVIREVGGLKPTGQIIINGNDDGGTWDGAVIVGDELGEGYRIVITPNTGDPEFDVAFEAPYYDALPSALGGGSIGLAPFHLHATACIPPLEDEPGDNGNLPLVYTDFDGSSYPVIIRSYGPVTNASVFIMMGLLDTVCPSADVSVMFVKQHAPGPANDPREIGIRCTSASLMKEGSFAVLPTGVGCDATP